MKKLSQKKHSERDEIVLKYMARIPKTVQSFLKKNPAGRYLKEDMCAEATFWVLHAATRHVTGHPIKNMPGYVHQCIMTGIMLALRGDKGIQKPRANTAKKVGGTYAASIRSIASSSGNGNISYASLYGEGDPTLIDACCQDDIDVDILLLTYRGRNHLGIGWELGISVRELKNRKVAIKKRLEAIESGEADVAGSTHGARP